MRSLILAPMVTITLLAGCGTIPAPNDPRVVQVQQNAQAICGYLPTAETVAKIIASFFGAANVVDMVSTAAHGICDAVTAKGAKPGAARYYRGIRVRGSFVR